MKQDELDKYREHFKGLHITLINTIYKDVYDHIKSLKDQDFVKRMIHKHFHTRVYIDMAGHLINTNDDINNETLSSLLVSVCYEMVTNIKSTPLMTYKDLFIALGDISSDIDIVRYDEHE